MSGHIQIGPAPLVPISLRAVEWLAHGDRGLSSETIFTHLTGIDAVGSCNRRPRWHPTDAGDLGRCRRLLEDDVPELRPAFTRMGEVSAVWKRLVKHWDALCALMDREAPDWREDDEFGPCSETTLQMKQLGC